MTLLRTECNVPIIWYQTETLTRSISPQPRQRRSGLDLMWSDDVITVINSNLGGVSGNNIQIRPTTLCCCFFHHHAATRLCSYRRNSGFPSLTLPCLLPGYFIFHSFSTFEKLCPLIVFTLRSAGGPGREMSQTQYRHLQSPGADTCHIYRNQQWRRCLVMGDCECEQVQRTVLSTQLSTLQSRRRDIKDRQTGLSLHIMTGVSLSTWCRDLLQCGVGRRPRSERWGDWGVPAISGGDVRVSGGTDLHLSSPPQQSVGDRGEWGLSAVRCEVGHNSQSALFTEEFCQ